MTTLITGAGLVGASYAKLALARDEPVVFLDPQPREDFIRERLGDDGVTVMREDVRSLPGLIAAIEAHKAETVLHTAALIGGRVGSPIHTGFDINIGGAMNVAEAVRLTGVKRLVHISTFGVYNWRCPAPEPIDEDFPRGPGSPYGNSKVAQEMIFEAYQGQYGFELMMLRPVNVFGVGHFWAGSAGGEKVQTLLECGLRGVPAKIPEQQTMAFEYVYAKDIGTAVDLAATIPVPEKNVFNLGYGEVVPFDRLVETARKFVPGLEVEIVPGTKPVSRNQHLDTTRAADYLGWKPAYTLETGLGDYVEDLKARMG